MISWLQGNVDAVIRGDVEECTILAYDFRTGRRLFCPPLSLPTGEGPFSEDARLLAFKRVFQGVFAIESDEDRKAKLKSIEVRTKQELPDRKKEGSHVDVLEWDFPTAREEIILVAQIHLDPDRFDPSAAIWNLRNLKPKSRIRKLREWVEKVLELDHQFFQV